MNIDKTVVQRLKILTMGAVVLTMSIFNISCGATGTKTCKSAVDQSDTGTKCTTDKDCKNGGLCTYNPPS